MPKRSPHIAALEARIADETANNAAMRECLRKGEERLEMLQEMLESFTKATMRVKIVPAKKAAGDE